MDMSDIERPPQRTEPAAPPADAPELPWRDVVADISAEIAAPLTAALERIHALTSSGRIDRASLRALRHEVEQARQVGMAGQQLTRIASGRLRQAPERIGLAETLQRVIAQRERDAHARAIALKPVLRPAEIIVDASLLFGLLDVLVDWAIKNARSQVELSIDVDSWPGRARLRCRFARDQRGVEGSESRLDALHWWLLEQTAWAMKLVLQRDDKPAATLVSIEFPRTLGAGLDGMTALEMDDGFAAASSAKPLAGSHVLVIAADRDHRSQIRGAIAHMGLIIDLVASVEEAEDFCGEGLPHAIVVESALRDDRFDALKAQIQDAAPEFVFIELLPRGSLFESAGSNGRELARVGGDAIDTALPSALMFELSRSM